MQTNNMFNFEYSYLSLPNQFYSLTKTNIFPKPKVVLINKKLCDSLNISISNKEDLTRLILVKNNRNSSFSQAYAGHQFGHFTRLGDGRAIILGEHLTNDKQRFDVQLKGSGKTPYSRGGDGKATLKSMLREYLISEAMHYLNIPSSRSLTLLKTGEQIKRENIEKGGILTRIMKSHIRVGTFEYASYYCSKDNLKSLTYYTINRLFPEINEYKNPPLALLNRVMKDQIDLVVNWMRVGFIHGVMNTDNTSISGETFDYGPCAFINVYNPEKSYSSIDYNNRYSFGNQPKIIKWNISRFAEALLPLIHQNRKKSIELAQSVVDDFDDLWKTKFYGMMLNKIGIQYNDLQLHPLIDDLLDYMQKFNKDYNNTFLSLSEDDFLKNTIPNDNTFISWQRKWKKNLNNLSNFSEANCLMRKNNPVVIPRNHLVEKAIEEANTGDFSLFYKLLNILSHPYKYSSNAVNFMEPSSSDFEKNFQTYCGT
ncbi:MAG: hypothetical protein CMP65_05255 [Flavobacteriales bacterium]|nr:hypothetical protein [Flavobacteriales bacterium]